MENILNHECTSGKVDKQIIARCNALNLKIVAGGPLFTSEHDEFKETSWQRLKSWEMM
ncbi:MAG: hypothetical protein P8012_05485 [Desulfobacterales bacterium]